MDNALVISAAGLAIAILSSAVGVTWKLARQEMALRAEFTAAHAELSAKLYQVEIWARDEFVRKGSFEIVIARMEGGFRDLRSEISGRLDKIAERLNTPH
jgi:hypothetical protein